MDCEERSRQQLLNGELIGRKNRTARCWPDGALFMVSGDDWEMDLPHADIVLLGRNGRREDVASELETRRRFC